MADRSPFVELLARLGRAGEPIRLAAEGGGHTFRTWPVQPEQIDAAVDASVERDQNVWYEINPSSFNEDKGRSSSRHITRLATLYVDVDFKPGSGMGSVLSAEQLIEDLTAALGVPPAAIVSTGNGLQPYWPISDGEITADTAEAVTLTLARFRVLVEGFARQLGGKIDPLFDLPRIFRVPGSMNMKDPAEPKPVTVVFPDGNQPFTIAELAEIFDDYAIAAEPREISDEPVSGMEEWEWAPHDCEFVSAFREEILHQPVSARHPWMLARAAMLHGMIRYGCLTEHSFEELRAQLDQRHQDLCRSQEPVREPQHREYVAALRWGAEQASRWSTTKLIDEMRSHTHTDFLAMFTSGVSADVPVTPPPAEQPPPPVISLFTKQPLPPAPFQQMPPTQGALALSPQSQSRLVATAHTDSGNAELFAQSIAGRFIHVSGSGWYLWDGTRYVEDIGGRVREALKDLFTQRLMSSNDVEEQKWLSQSLNNARMSATLKWAESVQAVQVFPQDLDRNPLELVTPAGVVDLASHTIRPANPAVDRNTKIAGVAPDWSDAPHEFLKILQFAFGYDAELIPYIQRLLGIALIGEQRAQHFPILRGPGGNGKSLLAHILLGVFGSYGQKLGPRFLVETRTEQHPESLASLRGIRWAVASEVGAGAKFNEQLVKELTGDTTIRARLMRENSSEWPNATSFWLIANHLPGVPIGGPAWWRRVRNIEMPNKFPEHLADDTLKDRVLAEEGGRILAWMIDGTTQYLAAGEQVPASVRRFTAKYRAEEDAVARYADTRLILDTDLVTTRQATYQDYQLWANQNRIFPVLSEPKFARELLGVLPEADIPGNEEHYAGFRLAHHFPSMNEAPYDALAHALGY